MHHLSKCTLTYNLWDHCADIEVEFGGTNKDIWGQIRIFVDINSEVNNQHWLLFIIGDAKTSMLQQNMW